VDETVRLYGSFSPTSWMALQVLLYDVMQMPTMGLPREKASTNKDTIATLIDLCGNPTMDFIKNNVVATMCTPDSNHSQALEILKKIQEYKSLNHTRGMVRNIARFTREGNLVHAKFKQEGADTGRLSCVDPPLQTMTWRSVERRAFVSRWRDIGGIIMEADYSQIELRILAISAQDPDLIAAFNSGKDIHSQVASRLFSTTPELITEVQRRLAKTASFGSVYGETPETQANRLGISVDEARHIQDIFFKQFPKLAQFSEDKFHEAVSTGVVYSIMGRKRFIVEVNDPRKGMQSRARNKATNSGIQGSASDLLVSAAVRIMDELETHMMQSTVINLVHDSMVLDIYPGELLNVMKIVRYEMEENSRIVYPWLVIPTPSDFEIGANWSDLCAVKDWHDDGGNSMMEVVGRYDFMKSLSVCLRKSGQYTIRSVEDIGLVKNESSCRMWVMI